MEQANPADCIQKFRQPSDQRSSRMQQDQVVCQSALLSRERRLRHPVQTASAREMSWVRAESQVAAQAPAAAARLLPKIAHGIRPADAPQIPEDIHNTASARSETTQARSLHLQVILPEACRRALCYHERKTWLRGSRRSMFLRTAFARPRGILSAAVAQRQSRPLAARQLLPHQGTPPAARAKCRALRPFY